jgi:hypothetical protein
MTKILQLTVTLALSACAPSPASVPTDAPTDLGLAGSSDASGTIDADAAPDAASSVAFAVPGLYHHVFSGSVNGTELSTWGPGPMEGTYELSDVSAMGNYVASFEPDGSFVFGGGVGSGAFAEDGSAQMDFAFGGGARFHSEMRRLPYTDARFPVFFGASVAGDASLTGRWIALLSDVDPRTGDTLSEASVEVDVAVAGSTVRLTLPDATYHQASWVATDQAALRVVSPPPTNPAYRTFPGCETSAPLDALGDLRVLADGSLTMTLAFQTRAALGRQVQTMQRMTLRRLERP